MLNTVFRGSLNALNAIPANDAVDNAVNDRRTVTRRVANGAVGLPRSSRPPRRGTILPANISSSSPTDRCNFTDAFFIKP